jgi:predicted kinase
MKTPFAHLITGATGAGKTTYARALADEIGGVHFAIDEWMTGLFAPDLPTPITPAWIWERVARCETLIEKQALQVLGRGPSAVLDLSFLQATDRQRMATAVWAAGFDVRLHWLDVPVETRWQRVAQRNAEKGPTYTMPVTRPMFDYIETRWQPPSAEEFAALKGVSHATA